MNRPFCWPKSVEAPMAKLDSDVRSLKLALVEDLSHRRRLQTVN
jgi:hypothetical protein